MIKLYQRNKQGKFAYKEAWFDEEKEVCVVHYGTVGRRGKSDHVEVSAADVTAFLTQFEEDSAAEGYRRLRDDELYWLVVQYPMKSRLGSKRDRWLQNKASEYLDDWLGWTGLGHVDGFDIGNFKLNIFCVVVSEETAVTAVKSCLRTSRLDLSRARIATRAYDSKAEYTLRYAAKPCEDFSVL